MSLSAGRFAGDSQRRCRRGSGWGFIFVFGGRFCVIGTSCIILLSFRSHVCNISTDEVSDFGWRFTGVNGIVTVSIEPTMTPVPPPRQTKLSHFFSSPHKRPLSVKVDEDEPQHKERKVNDDVDQKEMLIEKKPTPKGPPRADAASVRKRHIENQFSSFKKEKEKPIKPAARPPPLEFVASYQLQPGIILHICQGSVLAFEVPDDKDYKTSAIVNAANERCLGGGGVDGAISKAGGAALARDRRALPVVDRDEYTGHPIRCPTGTSVITGPGEYGSLGTPYVIHAVGPAYWDYVDQRNLPADWKSVTRVDSDIVEPNQLLQSAYQSVMDQAHSCGITDIGFSLLSAGVFRGPLDLTEVLLLGVEALRIWRPIDNAKEDDAAVGEERTISNTSVRNVSLCGFKDEEIDALVEVCDILMLQQVIET